MSNALYEERLARIRRAVALEPVDRIPIAPAANAYFARQAGVPVKDCVADYELACTANIKALGALDTDATQSEIYCPYLLSTIWLSKVKVPGRDLGPYLKDRCDDPMADARPFFAYAPTAKKRFIKAGIPCICDTAMIIPFEMFCGGRSLECFFMDDMMDNPDMPDEALKITIDYQMKIYNALFTATKPLGVWIGGWLSSADMISVPNWERFVWPYFQQYAQLCKKHGVTPIFHLDSCWDLVVERFRELPEKSCILAFDSKPDMRRAKKLVGDRLCIMGMCRRSC